MPALDSRYVAYVGPFLFPWGQPGSRRVYGIARSLRLAGRPVLVGSGQRAPTSPEAVDGDAGLTHVGLGELPAPGRPLLGKALDLFVLHGRNTVRWLEAQREKPTHVVVYGGHAAFMARLSPWCRRHGIRVLADVVEWYDPRQLTGGVLGPFHLSAKYALRVQYPRCDGIIAISSWLEEHYRSLGRKVVRIPPTMDVQGSPARVTDESGVRPLRLLYAGTPGRKDLLATVIEGVQAVDRGRGQVTLDLMGPSREEVQRLLGGPLPAAVKCLGRLPQWEVGAAYAEADFSVLLREPLRFAQAGFPTKVAESMAAGTPVICNITSDLGDFVLEGQTGFVSWDHGVEAFASALDRAIATNAEQRTEMRRAARAVAERSFDFRNYSKGLAEFMDAVGA